MRHLVVAVTLLAGASRLPGDAIKLSADGWFRDATGHVWLPLGGFHGNELPLGRIRLSEAERRRVAPFVWDAQKTDGQGHIDLWDAPDETLRRWFKQLSKEGVTAIRLFPRARIDGDTLDLCGKLNPELQAVFHRAFEAARPYGIRFLLQILPEPVIAGYWNHALVKRYALPRYTKDELDRITPAQRRFLIEGREVQRAAYFADPDVLACQKLYLTEALRWVASEPQVFALEVYNEQGQSRPPPERARSGDTSWQDAEIAWTAAIVQFIHERLPGMPVTISHPGHGITGYDPIDWSRRTGVDFYSSHFYSGLCGAYAGLDFSAVTAASTTVLRPAVVNFPGEWGALETGAPPDVLRRVNRDALWMTLLAGAPGFMQWTYDFVEEYRWPARVFAALPRDFSPDPAPPREDISALWSEFERAYASDLPHFMLNQQRRSDPALRSMYESYRRGLENPDPFQASPGWQVSYLADSNRRIWIAYIRSRDIKSFGKHFLGVPVPRPLEVSAALPAGDYRAYVIDLGRNRISRKTLRPGSSLRVSRKPAMSDYVVVISAGAIPL